MSERKLIQLPLTIGVLIVSAVQSELSCGNATAPPLPYLLLNLVTLWAVWGVFQLLFGRAWLSSLLLSILCTGVSIVNYYVILFKGSPLSFMELRNLGTALNVIGSYRFQIDSTVTTITILGLILWVLCILCRPRDHGHAMPWLLRKAALLLLITAVLEIGYLGDTPIKPKSTVGWLWREAYSQYGYIACTVESFLSLRNAITEPAGYDAAVIENIPIAAPSDRQPSTPDIILILNETFYDLGLITDPNADTDYLQSLSRADVYTGYAVTPAYGGGTNSSEYELLTSNSLQLMPGITPFNILDLTEANSVVSHLRSLGYDTLGAHSESGANYFRSRGYAALGFDRIYFDEAFQNKRYYHERWYETDESLYESLNGWYETMSEVPRFLYLLTIQNHGAWDLNPAHADTVHATSDYGDLDDDVDEYLTAIRQSDEAFSALTEYYAASERPVIICMVGDHCPSFADQIADRSYTDEELNLLYRKTPLLIWSNYDLGIDSHDLGTMSMNYVVPTLLDMAGIALSPYYDTMLELKKQVPVLTSYGVYYDSAGSIHGYGSDTPYANPVQRYFHLEYNNLSDHRRQSLFDAYR